MALIVPEVNPQPIPDVREQPTASLETFGGGAGLEQIGQETQKLTASAGEIAAFEKIKAIQSAVQQGVASASALHTDLLTNPQTGLPAYKGVNSMTGQDKLWSQWQKGVNDISAGLPREAQYSFNKSALSMGDTFRQTLNAHVSAQMDKHDANSFEALVKNETQRAATSYGNEHALVSAFQNIDTFAKIRAQKLGLDDDQTKDFLRTIRSNFHETVLSQMVNDPNFHKQAENYFEANKDDMDTDSKDRVHQFLDVVPKQQKAVTKAAQDAYYKTNMHQAMTDMFDGKLSLTEAQRRFRDGELNKSDYNLLEGKLMKPGAMVTRSFEQSDPGTFNEVRTAQLTGSADPGEVQRMIAKGAADKKITPDDGKYLLAVNSEKPPTPRDSYIEAQAQTLRDFGNKYFSHTNFLGIQTNKDETNQETEKLVSDFYSAVDNSKAQQGKQIDNIRDHLKQMAMQKRFPGLGGLDKAPDVVIDVKGKVTRVLNPGQRSGLKAKYRIVPTSSEESASEGNEQ